MKTITNIHIRYDSPERSLIFETPFIKKAPIRAKKHPKTYNSEGNRLNKRPEIASGDRKAKNGKEKVKNLRSFKPKKIEIIVASHTGHALGL